MTRTQLYLDDAVHARLCDLARRQGRTLSDLVREAIQKTFGVETDDERRATLRAIEGLWRDRKELGDTAAYVRRFRKSTRRSRITRH